MAMRGELSEVSVLVCLRLNELAGWLVRQGSSESFQERSIVFIRRVGLSVTLSRILQRICAPWKAFCTELFGYQPWPVFVQLVPYLLATAKVSSVLLSHRVVYVDSPS